MTHWTLGQLKLTQFSHVSRHGRHRPAAQPHHRHGKSTSPRWPEPSSESRSRSRLEKVARLAAGAVRKVKQLMRTSHCAVRASEKDGPQDGIPMPMPQRTRKNVRFYYACGYLCFYHGIITGAMLLLLFNHVWEFTFNNLTCVFQTSTVDFCSVLYNIHFKSLSISEKSKKCFVF